MSTVLDLINSIDSGKTIEMETVFNEIVASKMVGAIEAKREEIANNLFFNAEEQYETEE